jgi:uncharacterized protein DUF6916
MISRRRFLGAGSIAAVGAAFGSIASTKSGFAKGSSMESQPTRETFARLVNSTFHVQRDAMSIVPIRLTDVTNSLAGARASDPGHERFALVFHGPGAEPLVQATYRMAHESGTEFTIFIVPVGRHDDTLIYEAVFNRMPA